MRPFAAELIGTFALVFFGCGAIANGLSPTAVSVAFGLVIAVMIYALGHISGAHFNPAVSIGFAIGRHLPWSRVAVYAGAQVLGATLGALALRATLGPAANLGVTQPAGSDLQSFAWEVVLTFFLMLVITSVATDVTRGRGSRRARDRRHGRPGIPGRRAGQRRIDEPGALDRAGDRRRRPLEPLDLCPRAPDRGDRGGDPLHPTPGTGARARERRASRPSPAPPTDRNSSRICRSSSSRPVVDSSERVIPRPPSTTSVVR